jgi:hypothetical protein
LTEQVQLGFTVPKGEPYYIPLAHTIITGMTEYGKTKTQEAIISRLPYTVSPDHHVYKALVFLTKRGEKAYTSARHYMKPFYRERFDWEYVRSLLESTMRERLKFETPWIIKICKLAEIEIAKDHGPMQVKLSPGEGLKKVRDLIASTLKSEKIKDFDKNQYLLLGAYLDKVLPLFQASQNLFSSTLDLQPGLNVMDLTDWYTHQEMQFLIIRSCMQEILEHENNTIVGLPEAWKSLPQNRNTPVKIYFEQFIREGATNRCYLFLDAQDLGGIDKAPLRQVNVWIMGHMLEANEVGRLLKQTLGVDVEPKEIQTLPRGHFLVAAADKVTKVYVWPNGVPEEMAVRVARGELNVDAVKDYIERTSKPSPSGPVQRTGAPVIFPNLGQEEVNFIYDQAKRIEALSRRVDIISEHLASTDQTAATIFENVESLKQEINRHGPEAVGDLQNVETLLTQTTRKVKVIAAVKRISVDTSEVAGKILLLAKEGKLNAWKSALEITKLLEEKAWTIETKAIYGVLDRLVHDEYLGTRKEPKTGRQWKLSTFIEFEE